MGTDAQAPGWGWQFANKLSSSTVARLVQRVKKARAVCSGSGYQVSKQDRELIWNWTRITALLQDTSNIMWQFDR